MKTLAMRIALTLAVCCSAFHLNAQVADVSGGSLTITITAGLAEILATKNVSASAYTPAPYDWTIPFLGVQAGMFNMPTGTGAFSALGNLVVTDAAGALVLTVSGLQFEAIGKKAIITGTSFLNGKGITRSAILELTRGNPFPSPLPAGMSAQTELPATIAPEFAAMLANVYGISVPTTLRAAWVGYNVGFDPINY